MLGKVVLQDLKSLDFRLFVELVFAVVFVFNESADKLIEVPVAPHNLSKLRLIETFHRRDICSRTVSPLSHCKRPRVLILERQARLGRLSHCRFRLWIESATKCPRQFFLMRIRTLHSTNQ